MRPHRHAGTLQPMKHAYAAQLKGRQEVDPATALRELDPEMARSLRSRDHERVSVNVVVTALVPELDKVKVATEDGTLCVSLSAKTPGVDVRTLRVGQPLKVTLQGVLAPRVLSATLA